MDTTDTYPPEERRRIALTIRNQISNGVLMSLGMTHLASLGHGFDLPGLSFKARIIPTGQSKPRVMDIYIEYTPADLYKITVTYPKHGDRFTKVTHFEQDGVYAEDLNRVLLALDREG